MRFTILFQVGGRQGNLDRVAEHLFGPKGFFRTQDPLTLYKKIIASEYGKKAEEAISRGRRSVKSEVDGFDKNVSFIKKSFIIT